MQGRRKGAAYVDLPEGWNIVGTGDNIDVVNFVPGAGWQIAGTGDFNGDGRSDILARNTDGTITDWLGQADGSDNGGTRTESG